VRIKQLVKVNLEDYSVRCAFRWLRTVTDPLQSTNPRLTNTVDRSLLGTPVVNQILKKSPAFYRTQMFITLFTADPNLLPLAATTFQATTFHGSIRF